MPPGVPAHASAPSAPVLPLGAEATSYSEKTTATLMRAIVAYNRYHVRRVVKENSRWLKSWQDLPVHEHQPLSIRIPDSEGDLLTYVSPWKKAEAVISFKRTGSYRAGGNLFWLNPIRRRLAHEAALHCRGPAGVLGVPRRRSPLRLV